MEQLTQKLKDGKMSVLETPIPQIGTQSLLVRSHFSLISAGTESSTVTAARKSYIGKAKERPEQVRQVIDTLKSQGITQTYRAVMKKLEAYSPLGYSCAGEVIDMAGDVRGFSVGDLVACGGLSACHAEVVSVPANLCVRLEPDSDLTKASYNTIGAIAMQGVRQADLRLGETCAVIGLGLLGQITCLLLKASGVRVVGIDIDPFMVDTARKHCADLALNRDSEGVYNRIMEFTHGIGCDAVIITAATNSTDPINLAGTISRKRGTVVVVGAVPTGFDRDPHYYRKELQLRMSCSYGPGRYDPSYEEKGIDYPAGYVRWTENRNMHAFQELISSGKIDIGYLTTHTFKLQDAPSAYEMMLEKKEPFIGILIEYNAAQDHLRDKSRVTIKHSHASSGTKKVSIGFIGAGSYAQSNLIPNLQGNNRVDLKGVLTSTGTSSRSVGDRYGFDFCTGNEKDIIENPEINTVFIATRHNTHAEYLIKALNAGKHVFLEKPLCITGEELISVQDTFESASQKASLKLMVGYNRRFSPLARAVKDIVGNGPAAVHYRINAGHIPPDSWIQDPAVGGGRIIGEVCHFVDLITFLCGSLPDSVYASTLRDHHDHLDTLIATITYRNGSIGNICYFSNGDKALAKEHVEIFAHGTTSVIEDFRQLKVYSRGRVKKRSLLGQDKGQEGEISRFIGSILEGKENPIPTEDLFTTSAVTFGILGSIRTGTPISLHSIL
ncbi:MAG: bi-domain-containing oxidoreductase [Deltaproteobacteria bacterium]|nr:bi-domain-containing oxidoreductase [Deltaproteobacteria bacterium]